MRARLYERHAETNRLIVRLNLSDTARAVPVGGKPVFGAHKDRGGAAIPSLVVAPNAALVLESN
ncbi:MAG: hypothetical protein Q8O82_17125 [Pseudorhodobacter sp.]|nr:hypothetical protein [Pseudorhodobacter sp.]